MHLRHIREDQVALSLSYHRHLSGTDARLWKILTDGLVALVATKGGIRPLPSAKRDSPGSVPLPYWYQREVTGTSCIPRRGGDAYETRLLWFVIGLT